MVSPVREESSTVDEATDAPVTLGNDKSTTTDEQLVNPPRPQTEHTATPGLMEGKEHSATPGPSGATDDSRLGSPSLSSMPSVSDPLQGPNSSDEDRDVNLRNMKSILSHMLGSSPGSSQGFMHDLTKSREATLALHMKLWDFAITLEDVQLKYAEIQSRLQNADSLLLDSEGQIKFWKTFASTMRSEMEDLDARCKGDDLVIKELEDKVKILVKENTKASADIKALKESSRKVSEERDVINGQCKEKDLEIKRLEDNVAELEKNVKALKDSAHEATVSREELRRQYDDKILEQDLVIKELKEKVKELVEEKTTLEESSHKESEDRNGRIEEQDLVIKELTEKVKELVKEKNRPYADIRIGGNKFDRVTNYPPWTFPQAHLVHHSETTEDRTRRKFQTAGIAGIVGGLTVTAVGATLFGLRHKPRFHRTTAGRLAMANLAANLCFTTYTVIKDRHTSNTQQHQMHQIDDLNITTRSILGEVKQIKDYSSSNKRWWSWCK